MKRTLLVAFMAFMAVFSYAQKTIITTAPEGETKTYTRTGKTISDTGQLVDIEKDNIMTVVTTADGDVYIQNPISTAPFGSWIQGHQNGNTISIPTQQSIYNYQGNDLCVDMFELKDGKYVPTGDTEITFTIEDDGKLVLNGTNADGSRIMGLCGMDGFSAPIFLALGDCAVVCTPKEEEETGGIPEDAVSKQYTLTAKKGTEDVTGKVTVYRSGNKVFFKGLFGEEAPDLIAAGTIDADGNVTFTKGQYMGSFYGFLPLYLTGTNATDLNSADMTDIVFVYDQATDTYTLKTPTMILNGSADTLDPLALYTQCVLGADPTGISAPVLSDSKAEVTYYDITGKRIDRPTRGLVIKKVQQADGTTKTVKMLMK